MIHTENKNKALMCSGASNANRRSFTLRAKLEKTPNRKKKWKNKWGNFVGKNELADIYETKSKTSAEDFTSGIVM